MGSWLTYGLGSESQNLPGYVVLTAGRGASGGASNWSSGFLPSTYQGVLFRNQGEPVLNLANPPGLPRDLQRAEPRRDREPEPGALRPRWATRRSPAASPATSWPSACRRPRRS